MAPEFYLPLPWSEGTAISGKIAKESHETPRKGQKTFDENAPRDPPRPFLPNPGPDLVPLPALETLSPRQKNEHSERQGGETAKVGREQKTG